MNRDFDKFRNASMKLHDEEVERYGALLDYNILDSGPEECFDELARLAAYICKTPIALISFVDENREWLKSVIGIDTDLNEIPRDKSFSTYVINNPDEMLAISNLLEDERTKLNPFLNSHPEIKFIAVVPINDRNGYRLGCLCVMSYHPKDLSFEQISLLQTVARKVILELEQRRSIPDNFEQVLDSKWTRRKLIRKTEPLTEAVLRSV
jgi:GAF domain-containing protein